MTSTVAVAPSYKSLFLDIVSAFGPVEDSFEVL